MDGRYRVTLSPAAAEDMSGIADYLMQHRDRDSAEKFVSTIVDRAATLARFPLRGAVPKELDASESAGFRQIIFTPYRLIYSVIHDEVTVLLIADGRRDMQTLLRDRLLDRTSSATAD